MADEDQVQAEERVQEPSESTDNDLAKRLNELERMSKEFQEKESRWKKETAGLNKKISELEKEKMNDEEKAEAFKREMEQARAEKERYEADLVRARVINKYGLSEEIINAASEIAGAKEDDVIEEKAKAMIAYFEKRDAQVLEEYKNERAKNAYVPQSGGDADTLTRADVLKMSEEQIAAIPGDKLDAAMKRF